MNNYITLDGKRYAAPYKEFGPLMNKPSTERVTLSGRSDVTYGPATLQEWIGILHAPVTPRAGEWGDIDDLRATLAKRYSVSYTDHYGTTMTAYILGPHPEQSMSPMWDGARNVFKVTVKIQREEPGGIIIPMNTGLTATLESLTVIGGLRTVVLDELTLASSAVDLHPIIPIALDELTLLGQVQGDEIGLQGVNHNIEMNTLSFAATTESLTVT